MPLPLVSGPADDASQRLVRRSRIASYVLAALGAVVLSIAPSVVGETSGETARVLLHVVRPVAAAVCLVGAVAVQVVVGVRWRRGLRAAAEADTSDRPSVPPRDDRAGPRSTA